MTGAAPEGAPRRTRAAGWMNLVAGAVFVLMAIPQCRGAMPPNAGYGWRTARAFASEADWYALNRHAAEGMVAAGVALIALGALGLARPPRVGSAWSWISAFAPAWTALLALLRTALFERGLPG